MSDAATLELDPKVDPPVGYEEDFYLWTQQQAALLRARTDPGIDWENVAEEIQSLGRSEHREIRNRLKVLLMHLLKWQVQAAHRSGSWEATIKVQRRDIDRLLRDSPSLRRRVPDLCVEVYTDAVSDATSDTGLPTTQFPPSLPFSAKEVMAEAYLPSDSEPPDGSPQQKRHGGSRGRSSGGH